MFSMRRCAVPLAALCLAANARAQGIPTTQPNFVTLYIEEVKLGVTEAHARWERGWPAAYAKAKSPYYYLALVSMTGRNEAWYIGAYENHAGLADAMKREDTDSALSAALGRQARGDAQFLNGARSLHLRGRPELSYGEYPNMATQRFFEVTWFRVRPGHEAEFEAAAKAYGAAAKRAASSTGYRIYEIVAGAPGPTYLVFSSVTGFAEFDKMMANGDAVMKGATPEEMAALQKVSVDGLINTENQRFRLDPMQSYVSEEVKAQDAAFWKPPVRRPAGGNN